MQSATPPSYPRPAASAGAPAIDPNDPYRFVRGGTQLYLAGYYPGIQPLIVGESAHGDWYKALIDQMAASQVNLLRVALSMGMVLGNHEWRYPYAAGEGLSYWPDELPGTAPAKCNLDYFSDDYFDYWDQIVAYAAEKDVIVEAAILDGFHCKTDFHQDSPDAEPLEIYGLDFDFFTGTNNVNGVDAGTTAGWYSNPEVIARQMAFVERAVEALAHHENLIWETCNEPEPEADTPLADLGGRTWMEVIRDHIVAAEDRLGTPRHLIIPFDLPPHTQVAGHYVPSEGQDTLTSYKQVHQGLMQNREQWQQPLITDNDCCVVPGTPEQLRWKAWTSLVSGAYGSMLVYNVAGGSPPGGLGLDDPVIRDGMRYVGLTKVFIETFGVDLAGMAPAPTLVTQPDPANHPVWALARREPELDAMLVYYIMGGTATPTAPVDAEAHWFDPTTGTVTAAEPATDGSFTTPDLDHDWVLYLASGS